jgi:hypothetical protein
MFKLFRRPENTAPEATAPEAPQAPVIDSLLGLPIGEPGSAERLNWIFEEEDYNDYLDYKYNGLELGPMQAADLERRFGHLV